MPDPLHSYPLSYLHLFGLQFPVDKNGIISPPQANTSLLHPIYGNIENLPEGRFQGGIFANIATKGEGIVLGSHKIFFKLRFRILPDHSQTGIWYPALDNQPYAEDNIFYISERSVIPGQVFALMDGIFRISDVSLIHEFSFSTVQIENGTAHKTKEFLFRFNSDIHITPIDGLPLYLGMGPGGFRLDLSKQALIFEPGFLEAFIYAYQDGRFFFYRQVPSQYKEIPLQTSFDRLEFFFEPSPGETLPLHVTLLDPSQPPSLANPVLASLSARQYRIGVTLQTSLYTSKLTQISGIRLLPRVKRESSPTSATTKLNSPIFELLGHTYGDSRNQAPVFQLESLDLVMSYPQGHLPASLLIAPHYPEGALKIKKLNTEQMHGLVPRHEFKPLDSGHLICEEKYSKKLTPSKPYLSDAILYEYTSPWLKLSAQKDAAMSHAKPGDVYSQTLRRVDGIKPIEHLDFKGPHLALPLLSQYNLRYPQTEKQGFISFIEAQYKQHVYQLTDTTHETFLQEKAVRAQGKDQVTIRKLFAQIETDLSAPNISRPDIELNPYDVVWDYGTVKIQLQLRQSERPDYILLEDLKNGENHKTNFEFLETSLNFELDDVSKIRMPNNLKIGDIGIIDPSQPDHRLVGIVKLSPRYSLYDICQLEEIPFGVSEKPEQHNEYAINLSENDPIWNEKNWLGLILFRIPVNYQESLLESLVSSPLYTEYFALTPQNSNNNFSVSSYLHWSNKKHTPDQGHGEAVFSMRYVKALWYDGSLLNFNAEAHVVLNSFLGRNYTQRRKLLLQGVIDRKTPPAIRLIGAFDAPISLNVNIGPLHQIIIHSAEVLKDIGGRSSVYLNGELTLQKFDPFDIPNQGELPKLRFYNLQILVPYPLKGNPPQYTSISYPSMEFEPSIKPLALGYIKLKLHAITLDNTKQFPWDNIILLKGNNNYFEGSHVRLTLRLEMMDLPVLVDARRLEFEIVLGIASGEPLKIGIRNFLAEKLRFHLARFLELEFDKIATGSLTSLEADKNAAFLIISNGTMKIAGKTLVENVKMVIFSDTTKRARFLAYIPEPLNKTLKIQWLLLGHDVALTRNKALVQAITSLDTINVPNQTVNLNSTQQTASVAKVIEHIVTEDTASLLQSPFNQGWVLGMEIQYHDYLTAKFLYQDRKDFCGLIHSSMLNKWFGKDDQFYLAVRYIQGRAPGEDAFSVTLPVPQVSLGTFNFMGGAISLELVLNGGFTLDIGFPWLEKTGERLWKRTLGAIIFPYQGQGGFYLRKYHISGVETRNNTQGMLLVGGYAIQFGLGASYGEKVFRVWATVGIYAILEGHIHLEMGTNKRIVGLKLVGVVGILGRAGGELNWWIISARVEIIISAEAQLEIAWGTLIEGGSPDTDVLVKIGFRIYAAAHAEACIGSGFFKICKGIDVDLTMPFMYDLKLSG